MSKGMPGFKPRDFSFACNAKVVEDLVRSGFFHAGLRPLQLIIAMFLIASCAL